MEVRKGYKQTDVGIIPENWNIELLIQCCNYVDYRGKTPHKTSSGTFLITARNVRKGFIDYEISKEYVPTEEYDFTMSRGKPQLGDVIITTEAPLGNVAQIDREDVALAQRIIKYRPKDFRLSANYLKHYLISNRFQSILNSRSSGSTATGIKGSVLHQLPVVIPPLAEQEAIAEALSDADALIEAVDQLLTKKRQVKQGAMSELLTGKRRLSGFSGEWEVKKLGEVFEITAGGDFDPKQSSDIRDERFPYPIYSNALTDKGLYGFSSYNNHQAGSITVTARGTLGNANYRDHDFTAIGRVIVLKPTQPLDCLFISEFINNRIEFVVESTGVPQLTAPQISKYEIPFPEFAEQTAIAEILSDMDAEISALEEKLVKARQVKAGMMSELLVGKIRLV